MLAIVVSWLLHSLPLLAEEPMVPSDIHAEYYDRLLVEPLQLPKNTTFAQFLVHYQRRLLQFSNDEIAYFVAMQIGLQKCMHLLGNRQQKTATSYTFTRANDFYVRWLRQMYKNTTAKGRPYVYGTEPRAVQTFADKYSDCQQFFLDITKLPTTPPNFFSEPIFYPAQDPLVGINRPTESERKTYALVANYLAAVIADQANLKTQFWQTLRIRSLAKGQPLLNFKHDMLNLHFHREFLLLADSESSLLAKNPQRSPQRFLLQSYLVLRGLATLAEVEEEQKIIAASARGLDIAGKLLSTAALADRKANLKRLEAQLLELFTPPETSESR